MSRKRLIAVALAGAIGLGVPAANAGVSVSSVGTSEYPVMRVTVLTSEPSSQAPKLRENGLAVRIDRTENLGAEKSVVLAIDRSQSMRGAPLAHAIAAARSFVDSKPAEDRVAVASFATRPQLLTDFSTERSDSVGALRSIQVDPVQGTTLYDAVVKSANVLATEPLEARVMIVVTDGNETRSSAVARRRDRGRTQGRRVDLRRRHREPEVQPRPAPQARRGDGRRVPRHVLERHAKCRVRGHRGRAQAHVDARLRDHGPPRGHCVPRGDVEGREVDSEVDHAAGEPRPRLGRREAVAPAPRGLLQERARHAGDGDRLVLHRAPRRVARDDDGEGRTPEEADRAPPRAGRRQETQAGAGAARGRGRAVQRDGERLRGLEALEAPRPARGAQRPARAHGRDLLRHVRRRADRRPPGHDVHAVDADHARRVRRRRHGAGRVRLVQGDPAAAAPSRTSCRTS